MAAGRSPRAGRRPPGDRLPDDDLLRGGRVGHLRIHRPDWRAVSLDTTGTQQRRLGEHPCPSASLCIAIRDKSNMLVSTDPGGGSSSWMPVNWPSAVDPNLVQFNRVSCPTTSLCVAGGRRARWRSPPIPPVGSNLAPVDHRPGRWRPDEIGRQCYWFGHLCRSRLLYRHRRLRRSHYHLRSDRWTLGVALRTRPRRAGHRPTILPDDGVLWGRGRNVRLPVRHRICVRPSLWTGCVGNQSDGAQSRSCRRVSDRQTLYAFGSNGELYAGVAK